MRQKVLERNKIKRNKKKNSEKGKKEKIEWYITARRKK